MKHTITKMSRDEMKYISCSLESRLACKLWPIVCHQGSRILDTGFKRLACFSYSLGTLFPPYKQAQTLSCWIRRTTAPSHLIIPAYWQHVNWSQPQTDHSPACKFISEPKISRPRSRSTELFSLPLNSCEMKLLL